MPFTPFHLGPGALLLGVGGPRFSFVLFGMTQVAIDIEPAWYLWHDDPDAHRFVHTYLGATLVACACLALGWPAWNAVVRRWNRRAGPERRMRPVGAVAAVSGTLLGALTHVAIDSIMHRDLAPFSPMAEGNALIGVMSLETLHVLCILAGAAGLGLWLRRRRIR